MTEKQREKLASNAASILGRLGRGKPKTMSPKAIAARRNAAKKSAIARRKRAKKFDAKFPPIRARKIAGDQLDQELPGRNAPTRPTAPMARNAPMPPISKTKTKGN